MCLKDIARTIYKTASIFENSNMAFFCKTESSIHYLNLVRKWIVEHRAFRL